MKIVLNVLALALTLAGSTAAWAEEQAAAAAAPAAEVAATKAAAPLSLFPDSSVYVGSYFYLKKAGTKKNTLMFMPHFRTPILNKLLTLDAYAELKKEEDSTHIKKPTVHVTLETDLIANDYVLLAPYAWAVNPFQSKGSEVYGVFLGQLSLPFQTGIGKIAPYVLTESGIGVNISKTDLAATYREGPKGASLTGKEVSERGLESSVVGKSSKYPIFTYSRGGVGYTPAGVEGLKINFVVNVIASPSDTYTFDAKNKGVLNVESKWSTTTQPMIQINYKVNDKLAIRNETTRNYDGYFANVSKKQTDTAAISNMTRLTYTFY